MFTGLIEELGRIQVIERHGRGIRLKVKANAMRDEQPGDSISVNGVCLTVTETKGEIISFDVSPETIRATNLGNLKIGDRVNLERAMTLQQRLGGHIVTGHVDVTGTINDRRAEGEFTIYRIAAPPDFLRYVILKGSVAVDGISLTVIGVDRDSFSVALIPHTASVTTMGFKTVGDTVNLEADIIGKYIERFLVPQKESRLSGLLKEEGYI